VRNPLILTKIEGNGRSQNNSGKTPNINQENSFAQIKPHVPDFSSFQKRKKKEKKLFNFPKEI
jgi:hypothetical protein